ncbi:MAG: hypothetical protein QOE28_2370 [Solirubrobacteraceae bacterium]|jgi:hypothetical protein|nr:hypothetical protein [Solirubrobacteraceae bacterium]
MAVIEQFGPGADAPILVEEVDERAARRSLRAQIAHLERELAAATLDACPRIATTPAAPARVHGGPRLLSLGELERVRDKLAARLTGLDGVLAAQAAQQEESRALLDRMLVDPPAHKWLRISNAQLGEPGCKHFHVRPRLGLVGMLMGWWHVKISSGCPIGWGP